MTNFEPLAVIINPPPSSVLQIYPGQTHQLSVVVTNQEQQGMVVEVFLDLPERLRPWCKLSSTSFNLDGGRSQSVEFEWQIPPEVIPNRYHYDLVVDSRSLSSPLLYTLEIEVLTPIQAAVTSNDPTFSVQPLTSSRNPLQLTTSPLIVQVMVHNRSNLVDDFRLTCPDLEDNWYTVRYPEGIQQQGIIAGGNKLSLNPNSQGQITLLIHPPQNTLAGNYRPTIRVHSTVKPQLLLQDIFYLQIPPTHKLQAQLQVVRDRVKKRAAIYQIVVTNEGNTIREVTFEAGSGEEEKICEYQIEPPKLRVSPGRNLGAALKVTPVKKWGRPWFGAPKVINFQVDVKDVNDLPLPPYLPLKGIVLWEPRPWWQLAILVFSGLLTVSSLIFAIWWVFFRPPLLPEIESITPTESSYKFGQEIKLNIDINHPKNIKELKLVAKSVQGEQVIEPLIIEKTDSRCQIVPINDGEKLSCRNIATGAKEPKDYIFTLSVLGKKRWTVTELASKETSVIRIDAPPVPEVSNVGSPKNKYILPQRVDLKFQVSQPQAIERLDVIQNGIVIASIPSSEVNQVCKEGEQNNISCYIKIPVAETGEYKFAIQAIPQNSKYVKAQAPVTIENNILVEEAKIPLEINLFTINNMTVSPIKIKANQSAIAKWQVSGKNVKVNITGISQDLPAKGELQVSNLSPTNQPFPVELTATDGEGNTKSKILYVQVEAPPISPSIPIPTSTPKPESTSSHSPSPSPVW